MEKNLKEMLEKETIKSQELEHMLSIEKNKIKDYQT